VSTTRGLSQPRYRLPDEHPRSPAQAASAVRGGGEHPGEPRSGPRRLDRGGRPDAHQRTHGVAFRRPGRGDRLPAARRCGRGSHPWSPGRRTPGRRAARSTAGALRRDAPGGRAVHQQGSLAARPRQQGAGRDGRAVAARPVPAIGRRSHSPPLDRSRHRPVDGPHVPHLPTPAPRRLAGRGLRGFATATPSRGRFRPRPRASSYRSASPSAPTAPSSPGTAGAPSSSTPARPTARLPASAARACPDGHVL